MSGMRLALVTRAYWPRTGSAGTMMSRLADEFRRGGDCPVVVTALGEPHWPAEVVHRETLVHRLPQPRQRRWGAFRYLRAVARWLRSRRDEIDLVYVSGLRQDADAAIGALRGLDVPVVARAEAGGPNGDAAWQQNGRFAARLRRRRQAVDAVIAPSEAIAQEICEAGYSQQCVHVIANGVPASTPRSRERQMEARASLAEAIPDLHVVDNGPVVVYTGRIDREKGVLELPRAWSDVVRHWPDARLWLIGEGPDREHLYEAFVQHGVHHYVVMPGAFDDVSDVLQAADVFVMPERVEGSGLALLEAMEAGLPVIASDLSRNRRLVGDEQAGLLIPPCDARSLGRSIRRLLEDADLGHRLGESARQRVRQEHDLKQCVKQHQELFRRLIENRRAAPPQR